MDAQLTNAASNALHAAFLLAYFLGALRHGMRGGKLRGTVVGFFGVLLLLKLLGVWVHYRPAAEGISAGWVAISLLIVPLNYLLIASLSAPRWLRALVVALSAGSSWMFLAGGGDFLFIALPVVLIYLLAAVRARSTLRAGLLMAVASNLIWIAARQLTALAVGGEVPPALRYDNDLYHVMLIASTYLIYKGFLADAGGAEGGASAGRRRPLPAAASRLPLLLVLVVLGGCYVGGSGGVLQVWRPDPPELLREEEIGKPIIGVSFSPDGKRLTLACSDGEILLLDLASAEQRQIVPGTGRQPLGKAVAFSPDGGLLLTSSCVHVGVWDLEPAASAVAPESREPRDVFLLPPGPHKGGCRPFVSPAADGRRVAVSSGGNALVVDLGTGQVRASLAPRWGLSHPGVLLPDGATLVTAFSRDVELWTIP